MAVRPVRVGTRGSALSLWQAGWVVERLERALGGRSVEVVVVTTRGDELGGSLADAGEVGLFTSELERALVDGRVDVAVHSLKDLPVSVMGALPVTAVPLRGDPADALVSRDGLGLQGLPAGATVGSSSPRRESLVRALRPDVHVAPLRGNVDGRVRQLDEGRFDAIVLAVAGLERLGLADRISERLDPRAFPPAPGQGALALQAHERDAEALAAARALDDPSAHAAARAERACLEALGGGCSRPIGAHAWFDGSTLALAACVGSVDGARMIRAEASGQDPEATGRAAARSLLEAGASELLGASS